MHLRDIKHYPLLQDGRCEEVICSDGVKLRAAIWPATQSPTKGTVCLLQGRSEFIEKYYEVVSELRARGFAVATLDWRGQGGSDRLLDDPLKGHVRQFGDYGRDLTSFIKTILLPDCPPPYFALAHSMGGLILLSNLPRLRTVFDRAILSAPLIALAVPQRVFLGMSVEQSTIRAFAGLLRWSGLGHRYMLGVDRSPFGHGGFELNPLTSDGRRYDRSRKFFKDYPELALAGPTPQWLHEACKAMDRLQSSDFQSTIHTPTLIVTASKDVIVNSRAAEYFASTARAVHSVSIAGSKHEILMETDLLRQQFWAAFDVFIPGQGDLLRS